MNSIATTEILPWLQHAAVVIGGKNGAGALHTRIRPVSVSRNMITDIPTPADFQSIGVQLLNSAWDTAASLLIDVDEADHYIDDTNELIDAFWNAARLQLSTALSIAQQGSEFLLKGRIASVSPFLLLAAVPREGPAGCAAADKPFSDFRTIDAQDLIKVHNTCCSPRLPDSFVTEFLD